MNHRRFCGFPKVENCIKYYHSEDNYKGTIASSSDHTLYKSTARKHFKHEFHERSLFLNMNYTNTFHS